MFSQATLPSLSKRTVKLFVCLFVVVVLIANFTHQCRIFFVVIVE